MTAATVAALCDALLALRNRAEREPLGVDISDYSDEFCSGFLDGQANALDEVMRHYLHTANVSPCDAA